MSLVVCTSPQCQTTAGCVCQHTSLPAIALTPFMIKAAWHEARRWWPRKLVESGKSFIVKETCIAVDDPQPGFKEALAAALRAGGHTVLT